MLLAQMTLADKTNMVTGAGFSEPYVFYIAPIPSLCIPAIGEEDGPLGVGDGLTGVTQMPAAVSLAATFDPALAQQYGQVVGSEERAKGAMVNLGPTVNIDRDPRWGRSFEAFTEDPDLNAAMAVADIDGVQSQEEMAQVKHLAVYNQETNRNTPADDAIVSPRALHEIYLPAFWAATVQANASSAMCAYSSINGEFACQNQYLMNTTLDQQWGFPGFVTSDYQATHSTVQSADAGMDQEMPAPQFYGTALEAAVQSGQVSMATLNQMVVRIVTEMFRFNEFNNPPTGSTGATVTSAAHQAVSTTVAEAGTVLLKNSGATLPLRASGGGTVAVIGPAASASPTDTGGGSAYVTSTFNVTPLQGIQAAAGPGTTVQYTQGLPTDTSLSPIPSADLSPAYAGTGYGGSYTGTLTAPETGTYVLAFQNPGSYNVTYLSLDGKEILANPGTPPVSTYSVAVSLQAGHTYTLQLNGAGPSANLSWATPSDLSPGIAVGRGRGEGRRHSRGRRLGRHRVRGRRSGGTEPALRAGRAHLGGGRRQPAHRGRHQCRGARRDAMAHPGRGGARRLVSGREQRDRAGLGAVRQNRPEWPSAGDVPAGPHAGARVEPEPVPRRERPGRLLRGDRRRLPLLRRQRRDPAVPVRLWPVLHQRSSSST